MFEGMQSDGGISFENDHMRSACLIRIECEGMFGEMSLSDDHLKF